MIEDSIKHSVYYDYKMYIDDYFRLTNKHYDNQYPEKVKLQIDKYINKYKYKQYLILLRNFISYVAAIIGGVFIFDLILNMLEKLKRKIT